jgi:hypothetical protein
MSTVTRLSLLVRRDQLIAEIAEMPYSWTWVQQCSRLAAIDEQLKQSSVAA